MTPSAVVAFMTAWLALPAPPLAEASPSSVRCQEVLNHEEKIHRVIHQVAKMKLRLDITQSQGSRSPVTTALAANVKEKEQELVEYFEKNQLMTREQLTQRIRQEIKVLQKDQDRDRQLEKTEKEKEIHRRREQETQLKWTMIDGNRAILHRIEPGAFKMGEPGKQVDVLLTKPFDMMATPTTQVIWKKVTELANAKLGTQINIDPSKFKGDLRPVEMVSYGDVHTWLSALNELSRRGESALEDLISGHKQGDFYRLPTDAEWEYVVRNQGRSNDLYHFGNNPSLLKDYAWFNENSKSQAHPFGETQPVAQKLSLVTNNKPFYDMYGNVWEWVQDWYQSSLPGGIDPHGPSQTPNRVLRGGTWSSGSGYLSSYFRHLADPRAKNNGTGFRFVRELSSPQQ